MCNTNIPFGKQFPEVLGTEGSCEAFRLQMSERINVTSSQKPTITLKFDCPCPRRTPGIIHGIDFFHFKSSDWRLDWTECIAKSFFYGNSYTKPTSLMLRLFNWFRLHTQNQCLFLSLTETALMMTISRTKKKIVWPICGIAARALCIRIPYTITL